jgi:hypothetical protein
MYVGELQFEVLPYEVDAESDEDEEQPASGDLRSKYRQKGKAGPFRVCVCRANSNSIVW